MSATQGLVCCLGHCFSNKPKGRFLEQWQHHDTPRTGIVTKDKNAWQLCWYHYWHKCVTTQCTDFTEVANLASECLFILAHTSLYVSACNPIGKFLLQEIVKKKKKGKSQCQRKVEKACISDHWHIWNKNYIEKFRNSVVACVFIFKFLGISYFWEFERPQECRKEMTV